MVFGENPDGGIGFIGTRIRCIKLIKLILQHHERGTMAFHCYLINWT